MPARPCNAPLRSNHENYADSTARERSAPLTSCLHATDARFQPLSPLESLGGGGGLSGARLWRFRAAHGGLLLRAWPPHGPGREHIEQVHHWLSLTAELGFVPVPIRDRAGQSLQEWQGLLWEITPWLVGAADPSRPPALEHLRLAFTGLAAFHQRLAGEQVEAVSAGPPPAARGDQSIESGAGFTRSRRRSSGREAIGSRYQHMRSRGLHWLGTWPRCLLEPLGRAVEPGHSCSARPARCTARAFPVRGRSLERPRRLWSDGSRIGGGRPGALDRRMARRRSRRPPGSPRVLRTGSAARSGRGQLDRCLRGDDGPLDRRALGALALSSRTAVSTIPRPSRQDSIAA